MIDPPAQSRACACIGDCNHDDEVGVDELIVMVNVALGYASVSACRFGDASSDGTISVDEVVQAVGNALRGCAVPPPTATPIPTGTPTCGPCTSDAGCPAGFTCNAADLCLVSCECPQCSVCAGFCVPTARPTDTPTPATTPVLPHGRTCCECANDACTDVAWVEVEPACPLGCRTFVDAACEAPCHGGPSTGPAVCVSLTPCTADADCDDGNGCTVDHCTIDGCTHVCVCD